MFPTSFSGGPKYTGRPCPSCLEWLKKNMIRDDMVQPFPEGKGEAALSRRQRGVKLCSHCAKAEGMADVHLNRGEKPGAMDGHMRTAVGNEFAEALRMPTGMAGHFGMKLMGHIDSTHLEPYYRWLESEGFFQPRRHKHDCEKCDFLGHYGGDDLYYCHKAIPTVIARHSDEPSDYASGLAGAKKIPALGEAKRRAESRGLLNGEKVKT